MNDEAYMHEINRLEGKLYHYKRRERQLTQECERRDGWIVEMKEVLDMAWENYPDMAQFAGGMKIKLGQSWSDWDERVRVEIEQLGAAIDRLRHECPPTMAP